MSERVSSSIIKASNLPDTLITRSIEEYKEKAIELSTHPEDLLSMRSILEDERETCPLFDTKVLSVLRSFFFKKNIILLFF